MMNVDESTTDGNIEVLSDFQKMLGLDGKQQQSVVGDQCTCKNIRAAKRRRTGEVCLVDSLQWAKENPGDFHFLWECSRVLCNLYWGAQDIPGSLAHLQAIVDMRGMTKNANKFKETDEFIHHALDAHLIKALCHHFAWDQFH